MEQKWRLRPRYLLIAVIENHLVVNGPNPSQLCIYVTGGNTYINTLLYTVKYINNGILIGTTSTIARNNIIRIIRQLIFPLDYNRLVL